MKPGALWKISVAIAPEAEEAVVELLSGLFGTAPSIYVDVETRETVASVYLPKLSGWTRARRARLAAGLKNIRACGLELGPGKISARKIRREDWAESWKRHFHPLEISPVLLIKPSWSGRHPRRGQAVVVLDPGLSFGTGQHPTTAFCLEQLVARRVAGAKQSLLDIGCGSGILSIAAAKLGYAPVRAFDFDPEAVRVARENMALNGVRVRAARQDLTRLPARSAERYDVVCANLIFDLLLAERRRILHRLKPEGTLVLAGILTGQFPKVRAAFEGAGMKLVAERALGEWRSGAFGFLAERRVAALREPRAS